MPGNLPAGPRVPLAGVGHWLQDGTLGPADGLWIVQSRTAMLEIYLGVFVLAEV